MDAGATADQYPPKMGVTRISCIGSFSYYNLQIAGSLVIAFKGAVYRSRRRTGAEQQIDISQKMGVTSPVSKSVLDFSD